MTQSETDVHAIESALELYKFHLPEAVSLTYAKQNYDSRAIVIVNRGLRGMRENENSRKRTRYCKNDYCAIFIN